MPAKKGYKWFNNGEIEVCSEKQPEGFIQGRLPLSLEIKEHYKNNGLNSNKISKEQREEINKKISLTKQNKSIEDKKEYSEHVSLSRKGKGKGKIPWNKGLKGVQKAWNKGLTMPGHSRTFESLEKARQTCLEKYGVEWACQRQEDRLKGQNSNANLEFEELLKNNNIDYSREFPINSYSYDFKIGKYLIEINPYATHNSTWGIRNNKPKEPTYHKTKSKLAMDNGYFCIHIFDWDNANKIINKFTPKEDINAEDCSIKTITIQEAKDFLNNYHPQNYTNDIERYGLYYKDELVEVMTFSKPRYNKKYEWELVRVCAKPEYHILGGCKKLLDEFITKVNPNNIIVYCDLSKLNGSLYDKLGFKQLRYASPTKHWYNPKTKMHVTDSFLWKKGFDRLFGTSYGKGASNEQLMLEHGFVEIYDCGQATYIWQKDIA